MEPMYSNVFKIIIFLFVVSSQCFGAGASSFPKVWITSNPTNNVFGLTNGNLVVDGYIKLGEVWRNTWPSDSGSVTSGAPVLIFASGIASTGMVLTANGIGAMFWGPASGGDASQWSSFPALTGVNGNGQVFSNVGSLSVTGGVTVGDSLTVSNGTVNVATVPMLANLVQVFNVRSYGALGNGVTNDAPAIQAALDAAIASTNGVPVVLFPAGTYLVTNSVLTAATNFCLVVTNSRPLTLLGGGAVISNPSPATLTGNYPPATMWINNSQGLTLDGLEVAGYGTNAATSGDALSGIVVSGSTSNLVIQNSFIHDFVRHGVVDSLWSGWFATVKNSRFDRFGNTLANDGHAVALGVRGLTVADCRFSGANVRSIELWAGVNPPYKDAVIAGNTFADGRGTHVYMVWGLCTNVNVTGLRILNNSFSQSITNTVAGIGLVGKPSQTNQVINPLMSGNNFVGLDYDVTIQEGVNGALVSGLTSYSNRNTSISLSPAVGVLSNVLMEAVDIQSAKGAFQAVYVHRTRNLSLNNISVRESSGWGVKIQNTTNVVVNGGILRGNTTVGIGDAGGSGSIVISGLLATNNTTDVFSSTPTIVTYGGLLGTVSAPVLRYNPTTIYTNRGSVLTIDGVSFSLQNGSNYTWTTSGGGISAAEGTNIAIAVSQTASNLAAAAYDKAVIASNLAAAAGGGAIYTNRFRVGISPMSGLAYGSTNDALVVGVAGANAYWGEAQFSETTEQRFRVTISPAATARWTGGALTNQIWWRGTATVGSVVWQIAYIGATNNGLVDLAYQNLTIGSNTVSGVASNINVTTIIITPTNTPAGSLWLGELRRLPANASDTMAGDARMLNWTSLE